MGSFSDRSEEAPRAEGTHPRVLVLGAGFAGLQACAALMDSDVEVTVVDRHNYNTFQPLLYQVATAGLSPGDIAYPVRAYVRAHQRARFRRGVVEGVDLESGRAQLEGGASIAYDYLVIATGAATNFFGVAGASEHSHAIYTMEDAVAVRDRTSAALEDAAAGKGPEGELTIVIVGGGPTGVEMAGTLAELRSVRLRTLYPELDPASAKVVLVEQQERLLSSFDKRLSKYATKTLARRGVDVRCRTAVEEVRDGEVVLAGGERLACGLVIWAAGVGATPLACRITEAQHAFIERSGATPEAPSHLALAPRQGGRLSVGPDLALVGFRNVFAVGDVAGARQPGNGDLFPQLAQPAIQQGRHAGRQIARLVAGEGTEPFRYKDRGVMATIGRRAAVAELRGGIRLRGTLAWLAWLGLHIVFLLGARNRASVLLNWAWRYVYWRSPPKVIAGS